MRSEAEKTAWKAKINGMIKKIRALPKPAQRELAMKCGTRNPENRELSPFNCCLLMAQAGGAFPLAVVGGFRQWQRAGRHVTKGQHACGVIWVPIGGGKKAETEGEEEGNEATRFILVPVFDLTQTAEGAGEKDEERESAAAAG